jgi:hypothetical protein
VNSLPGREAGGQPKIRRVPWVWLTSIEQGPGLDCLIPFIGQVTIDKARQGPPRQSDRSNAYLKEQARHQPCREDIGAAGKWERHGRADAPKSQRPRTAGTSRRPGTQCSAGLPGVRGRQRVGRIHRGRHQRHPASAVATIPVDIEHHVTTVDFGTLVAANTPPAWLYHRGRTHSPGPMSLTRARHATNSGYPYRVPVGLR